MQKLFFIDCYNGSPIKDMGIVDLRNSEIINFKIDDRTVSTEQTDSIYTASAVLTPKFPYFDLIVNDTKEIYGFRYETEENNIAFVIRDKSLSSNGKLTVKLESSISILQESFSYPDVTSNSLSIATILSNLNSNFTYTLISPDDNIVIDTAIKNDYDVLKEIMKEKDSWAFRENKLLDQGNGRWKTEILIGKFNEDIEGYYNASPSTRPECKPLTVSSTRTFDNTRDVDQVIANDVNIDFQKSVPNRLYVFGDNNQGMSQNARIELNPFVITQRPDFPLGSSVKNGRKYYYITNINTSPLPIREHTISYSSSSNTQDQAGNQTITPAVTSQQLYNYGCSYLQALQYKPNLKVDNGLIKKFVLPGNIVYRNIKRAVKISNTETKIIIDIQNKGFLNTAPAVDIEVIKN